MAIRSSVQSIASLAALILAVAPAFSDDVLTSDTLTVISNNLDLCHDPVIAAGETSAVAAWTALFEGRKRLFVSDFNGTRWSAAVLAENSTEGDCGDSVAKFSPSGQPALVWSLQTSAGYALNYRQLGGFSEQIAESPLRMETPSLAFDAEANPIVAWSEGGGGKFAVMVARRSADGWTRYVLSEGLDAYDILPAAIGGPAPTIYWYRLGSQDFSLTASQWNGTDWADAATGLLGTLPANRLPYLYDTQTTLGPGAVWIEPLAGGELVLTADPRFAPDQFVQPLPGADLARQLEPDATSDANDPAFAWREETSAGSDIIVLNQTTTRITGVPHMTQPRIARQSDGTMHLLFISDQIEGGTGQVYTTTIPFISDSDSVSESDSITALD